MFNNVIGVEMADEPVNQQSMTDDQELAKVLAGVTQQANDASSILPDSDENSTQPTVDETPMATPPTEDDTQQPQLDPQPVSQPEPQPSPASHSGASHGTTSPLDSIKLEALNELRPLVDKLDVSAEERFDTYLLLLRSTDDKELIAPAHEAAKNIADEARRAQALLDIIKEIDFLSQNAK